MKVSVPFVNAEKGLVSSFAFKAVVAVSMLSNSRLSFLIIHLPNMEVF
jgi:hypothetical protein